MLHPGGGQALLWWTRRRECRPSLQLSSRGPAARCSSADENSGTEVIPNSRCFRQSLDVGVITWKVSNESSSAFDFMHFVQHCHVNCQCIICTHVPLTPWCDVLKHCTALAHREKVHKKTLHWVNLSDLMQKISTTSSVGGNKNRSLHESCQIPTSRWQHIYRCRPEPASWLEIDVVVEVE